MNPLSIIHLINKYNIMHTIIGKMIFHVNSSLESDSPPPDWNIIQDIIDLFQKLQYTTDTESHNFLPYSILFGCRNSIPICRRLALEFKIAAINVSWMILSCKNALSQVLHHYKIHLEWNSLFHQQDTEANLPHIANLNKIN